VFGDKGSFSPVHGSDDFGTGGNFDWDQRNRGVEAGIDFGVGGNFALGLIAGRSSADLELNDGGIGSADIDATSWGVYGLLMSGGWYLDASYRWIDFDVELDSVAGTLEADGDAKSFNIETGYAFGSPGSFQVVPQVQYTRTRFDAMDPIVSGSGMSFRNDGGNSSRTRVGVSLQKSFGDADTGWLFTPYASFSVVREMDGDYNYSINDALFGFNSVGGTSHLVELGFTGRSERVAVYGGLSWQDGGRIDSAFGGHLGVRYTFGGATPAPAPVAVAVPVKTCADLDDDGDGVNNCEDKCAGTVVGTAVGMDGCPVPAPAPAPEPVMEPKPYRG
jgi:outer membrane autotransporter protein